MTENYNFRTDLATERRDFVFIFLSFISYLWIDEIQAKVENIKSIDNSLDWFWKRV